MKTDQNFTKIVRLGTIASYGGRRMNIFCTVEFKAGKLSISGVEGPLASGNCVGGCGQIDMHLRDQIKEITPAPGWDCVRLTRFFQVWKKWHLNDTKAGSPAQEAFLDANKLADNGYVAVSHRLADAGLNPDPNHLVNGAPYKYGSAWLRVEVPADAVEFLRDLPDADKPLPAVWRK